MKKALVLLLALSVAFVFAACGGNDTETNCGCGERLLSFNPNGEFTVVQFTDTHEWLGVQLPGAGRQYEWKDYLKPLLYEYINAVLDQTNPDLVVLTGDNIFSLGFWEDLLLDISIKTYRAFADLFEEREQYWTMTFGNHDSESAKKNLDFLNAVSNYSYFIGGWETEGHYETFRFSRRDERNAEDDRVGNFSIPVYGNCCTVLYNIFLLDSGGYNHAPPPSHLPYRYILQEQTDWYLAEAARLKQANGGVVVPSLMFTHIPLLEHEEAFLQGGQRIGVWTGIHPSTVRSPIFEAAFATGDVRGFFVGHSHTNSISVFYERDGHKMMLGVTPATQAASYTDTSSTLRSRVITLNANGNFSTYIHTSETNGVFRDEVLSFTSL